MMKMQQTLNKIKPYFPENKIQWKKYTFTAIPVILSSVIFALNAFVDNFMSTNIEGGNQALSYANTWTEIEVGIIALTTLIGSSLFSQFLGKQDFKSLKEVIAGRILFAFLIGLLFSIPAWITPWGMVSLISGFDKNMLNVVHTYASNYLRLITVSWLLNAIWFTISMIAREKHHGVAAFISSLISLIINIVLNSIFIFHLNLGIEFLAYSTIISNICALIYLTIFFFVKDKQILINPLKLFCIDKKILKMFFKRSFSFIFLSIGSCVVNLRFVFWNLGYPTGSIGQELYVISAANILGISGMFFNIFWTAFDSVNANVAIYVGKELGANNIENAQKQAKELLGFHLITAIAISILLFAFSFVVEQMTFLANGYKQGLISHLQEIGKNEEQIKQITNDAIKVFMENLKWNLWPLALFIPMFIWFITKSRIISIGGYTNLVALIEGVVGTLQLGWLAIVCLVINKDNSLSFAIAYFIFFFADVPKLIIYDILFKKVNWTKNITEELIC